MTTPSVLSGDPKSDKNHHASGLVWDFMRLGFGRRALSLAEFGLLYSTCMIIGLLLRESSQRLTIIWPAAAQRIAGAHGALGLGVPVFAIQHWFFAKRRDMRSADSRPW